jgi:site-specific recombinase XerD
MSLPLAERLAAFLDYAARERELSPATIAAYRRDLAALGRYAAGAAKPHPLETARPEDLLDFLRWERSRGISETTLRRRLATLRSYLDFAELEGYPEGRLRPPRLPDHVDVKPRDLARDVVELLLATARQRVDDVRRRSARREAALLAAVELLRRGLLRPARLRRLRSADLVENGLDLDGKLQPIEDGLTAALRLSAAADPQGLLLSPLDDRTFRRELQKLPGRPTPTRIVDEPDDGRWDEFVAELRGRLRHLAPALDLGPAAVVPAPPAYRIAVRDCALLELLYAAGLRISEALGLVWRAVELDGAYLRVRGKGGRNRVVPFGEVAAGWLRRLRRRSPGATAEDHVFRTATGRALDRHAVYRRLGRLAAAAGLEAPGPHQLRHSFATHLLAGDAGVRLVSELLGHRRLSETQRYTRVEVSRLRRAHRRHPRARSNNSLPGE